MHMQTTAIFEKEQVQTLYLSFVTKKTRDLDLNFVVSLVK